MDYDVVKSISERDGISIQDAQDIVDEVMEEVQDCIDEGDFEGAEDAWQYGTGLEPDYLMEMLM